MLEIPRRDDVAEVVRSRYRGLEELLGDPPDALIVTGTEPKHSSLLSEPYWPALARLLEWAADRVPATMLSCLAAHASVLLFDGIERVPGARKCSGVFAGAVRDPDDPLVADLPGRVPVPHSRVNSVPEEALVEAGYRVVIGSGPAGGGWALATRFYGDRLFVLSQGHPEYSTLSLLREYRRDVRRTLLGGGAVPYPYLPEGYLNAEAAAVLERFAERAAAGREDPVKLWAAFPFEQVAVTVGNTWAQPSAVLYANWLALARTAAAVHG